jgi:hypothetical protein
VGIERVAVWISAVEPLRSLDFLDIPPESGHRVDGFNPALAIHEMLQGQKLPTRQTATR